MPSNGVPSNAPLPDAAHAHLALHVERDLVVEHAAARAVEPDHEPDPRDPDRLQPDDRRLAPDHPAQHRGHIPRRHRHARRARAAHRLVRAPRGRDQHERQRSRHRRKPHTPHRATPAAEQTRLHGSPFFVDSGRRRPRPPGARPADPVTPRAPPRPGGSHGTPILVAPRRPGCSHAQAMTMVARASIPTKTRPIRRILRVLNTGFNGGQYLVWQFVRDTTYSGCG
jgi:hypothetical protein